MSKRIFTVIVFLLLALFTACDDSDTPTAGVVKEEYAFQKLYDEITAIDEKYGTSFYEETMNKGIDKETVAKIKAEVQALKESLNSRPISNIEELNAFLDFRVNLVEAREAYLEYYEIGQQGYGCENKDEIIKAADFLNQSVGKSIAAGKFLDKTLNSWEETRLIINVDDRQPKFYLTDYFKYRKDVINMKYVMNTYCGGTPINEREFEIKDDDTGVIKI